MQKSNYNSAVVNNFLLLKILIAFFINLSLLASSSLLGESLNLSKYRLDSGDRIKITVFDEADMSLEISLGDSGVINYPYLGEIRISGLTINELEIFLTTQLKPEVLINPSIQVSIIEYRPFFIDGEVNSPGGYPYQPGLNVSKAIALAGGKTERGSEDKVYVVRATDKNNKKIKISLNDSIYPGDIITIEQSFF
jgi:protein involved in polysaccharide export with SLBB domain